MTYPRPLTRANLTKFLPNQRAIRAFEKLFDLVPSDIRQLYAQIEQLYAQIEQLYAQIEEASLDANSANSKAVSALALLSILKNQLDLNPPAQKDIFLKGDYVDLPLNGPHIQNMAQQNAGASGSFTTADGKTVTVSNGVVTNII